MKITKSLRWIGVIPSLILFIASSYLVYFFYLKFENASLYQSKLENNKLLEKALIEMDKERGLIVLSITSENNNYQNILKKQQSITDQAIKDATHQLSLKSKSIFEPIFNTLKIESNGKKIDYSLVLQSFKNFKSLRLLIEQSEKPNVLEFIKKFERSIDLPLVEKLSLPTDNLYNSSLISVSILLNQIYKIEDAKGMSRDLPIYYIQKSKSMSLATLDRWKEYLAIINSFNPNLISNRLLKREADDILNSERAKDIFEKINTFNLKILSKTSKTDYGIDITKWFTLQSESISIYNNLSNKYINTAQKEIAKSIKNYYIILSILIILILISFIQIIRSYRLPSIIENNFKELELSFKEFVKDFSSNGEEYKKIFDKYGGIDFSTQEKFQKSYKLIEELIEQVKEERLNSIEDSEAKSIFLANMSHEIRTPMNGIIGFTKLLKSTNLTKEQREFINNIDESSQNLINIINNILDLSKLESNIVELEQVIFDTHKEFDETVDKFGVKTAEKDIELYYFINPNISPVLKGDAHKIKEILNNLIDNAIKFTPKNGEISVEINKLNATKDGRSLIEFKVIDNGIGMSESQVEKIFKPFRQANSSINKKYGGTGIGLAITKEYVELLGGKLNVETKEEVGTTFSFIIPIEETSEGENYHFSFKGITLYRYNNEDTTHLNKYLDIYAEYLGLNFIDFDSISKIKEIIETNEYQTILVDYDKATDKIKEAMENLPSEKLVIIARATNPKAVDAYKRHDNNLIVKPFTFNKFLKLIKSILHSEHTTEKTEVTPMVYRHYKGKVLVVEDNTINQRLITQLLNRMGLEVETASNGQEGVEKRFKNHYDLIFMDIQMPVMNGIEATHEILETEKRTIQDHIPIVALTANALKGDRERFLSEGMDEYMSKPIEMSELLYILNKFIGDKAVIEKKNIKDDESKSADSVIEKSNTQTKEIKDSSTIESLSEKDINSTKIDKEDETPKLKSSDKEILLAKSLPFSQKIMAKFLDSLGHSYEKANNSSEIEEILKSQKFSIIFTDEKLLNDRVIQLLKGSNILLVFSNEPKEKEKFKDLNYVVHSGKLTQENLKNFIDKKGK